MVGAARLYVSDAKWRDEVDSLLARSRLVVLRVSVTDGSLWEVERAIKRVPPERLLFFSSWT